MAMTLRLTDEQHEALAAAAERTGVSMHAFAVQAIENDVSRTQQRDRVLELTDSVRHHHRELLDRLGQ